MKRLILLISLICVIATTNYADTWSLNTWTASGELDKLPSKEFKVIANNTEGLLYIDIPNGIQLKNGDVFGVKSISSGYYKNATAIIANGWYVLTDWGYDAKIIEDFTCYQIFFNPNTKYISFSKTKPIPKIFTWTKPTPGAFSSVTSGERFTLISGSIYKIEIPNGSVETAGNGFFITTTTTGGEIYYKAADAKINSANTWNDVSSSNNSDVSVAGGTYYKILFDLVTKKFYNSTIPLSATPTAPTVSVEADGKLSVNIEFPTEITSVSKEFISKAIITRTCTDDNAVVTYEIAKADLDGKAATKYIDIDTDIKDQKAYIYTVKYEYIDFPGSTETLTSEESEGVRFCNVGKAFDITSDIQHNASLGNAIFVGVNAQWLKASDINGVAPKYTLVYVKPGETNEYSIDTNPSVAHAVCHQPIYGIPANSTIKLITSYSNITDGNYTSTETPSHPDVINTITVAPTGLTAESFTRYAQAGTYSATIFWKNESLAPITSYAVKHGDANADPIVLNDYDLNYKFIGVQNLLSTGITYSGEHNKATIRYSVAANYSIGNTIKTEIKDEDFNSTDVSLITSDPANLDVVFDIDTPTGVNDATNDVVAIYPNPTTGTLVINNTTPIENISIFNIAGGCVREINGTNDTSATINVEDLAQGTYFVKVNSKVTKVIKK